jgi:hypothetical protein
LKQKATPSRVSRPFSSAVSTGPKTPQRKFVGDAFTVKQKMDTEARVSRASLIAKRDAYARSTRQMLTPVKKFMPKVGEMNNLMNFPSVA